MWCEASLTGFSHMMFYQQAANERKCPGKIQGKCFNYFGTFSKMVDSIIIKTPQFTPKVNRGVLSSMTYIPLILQAILVLNYQSVKSHHFYILQQQQIHSHYHKKSLRRNIAIQQSNLQNVY